MTSAKSETIEIDDCRLVVRRVGRGRPLLWLHGTDGFAEWPAMIDRLGEHHEVIAPDHPGFGESTIPGWMGDVSDLAYLYLDLLVRLGIERAEVVGHSLGGWIALEMAVRQTQRISSLALIAPAGLHVKGVSKCDIFMIDPDEQARLAFADPVQAEVAAVRASAGKYQEIAIANRVASARFGWNPRFHNPRLQRWLHRVDVPTLVVWGEDDRIFAPGHAEAFVRGIPGSRLAMIEKAGHMPHVERIEETHRVLVEFLVR
jgi:pimeloyl-ACP methyl ester carboxylesterase